MSGLSPSFHTELKEVILSSLSVSKSEVQKTLRRESGLFPGVLPALRADCPLPWGTVMRLCRDLDAALEVTPAPESQCNFPNPPPEPFFPDKSSGAHRPLCRSFPPQI